MMTGKELRRYKSKDKNIPCTSIFGYVIFAYAHRFNYDYDNI